MARKMQPHEKFLVGCALVALVFLMMPLIWSVPDYEALEGKEITVRQVGRQMNRYVAEYYLITDAGERMEIRGELDYKQLQQALQPGTQAAVKYYRGLYGLVPAEYIKELTCGGEGLVFYSGDSQGKNRIVFAVMAALALAVGLGHYEFCTGTIKKWRKRRKKQRESAQKRR